MPNANGYGTNYQQVMQSPGFADNTGSFVGNNVYNASQGNIAALQQLMSQIPQAPSYDPQQAMNYYMQTVVNPKVASYRAMLAHGGMQNSSFGGGLLGDIVNGGLREAADYGNQVAQQNYNLSMQRFNQLAALTGQVGQQNYQGALAQGQAQGNALQNYAAQQAYSNFKPFSYNSGQNGLQQRLLGAGAGLAASTLPTWGPALYNGVANGAGPIPGVNQISGAVGNGLSNLGNWAGNAASAGWNGLQNAGSAVGNWLGNLFGGP